MICSVKLQTWLNHMLWEKGKLERGLELGRKWRKAKDRILIIPRRVLMEANCVRLGLAGLANEPH